MLLHLVPSVRWGGPQRYALDICRYFGSETEWRVAAMTCDALAVDGPFREAGVGLLHAPLQGLGDLESPRLLAAAMRQMPEGERNVVHAHRYRDAFTALVARRLSRRGDVRIVVTRHTVERGRDSWLYRAIYPRLDAQIFVSQAALERFCSTWRHRRLPVATERLRVIHNSLYLPGYEPQPEPGRGAVTAMYHGRLAPGKGLETLIDALGLLRDKGLRLRIVGSGPPDYVDQLRRRAAVRGVDPMIDWHRHTADPHPLIAASHFGVLPSVRREGCGMANIEYMANGRPQVTTANGAQDEYLTPGSDSLFVPVGDPQSLASAMMTLAADGALRRDMGAAAMAAYRDRLAWPHALPLLRSAYAL